MLVTVATSAFSEDRLRSADILASMLPLFGRELEDVASRMRPHWDKSPQTEKASKALLDRIHGPQLNAMTYPSSSTSHSRKPFCSFSTYAMRARDHGSLHPGALPTTTSSGTPIVRADSFKSWSVDSSRGPMGQQ